VKKKVREKEKRESEREREERQPEREDHTIISSSSSFSSVPILLAD
jgi:hypothetical protein